MDVHAKARFIRMSPRKVRLVVDLIRGMSVVEADAQLAHFRKAAALPVRKLLQSAIANAEHNFHLNRDALRVRVITVDGGPTIKRFRPRAMGRAAPIRKRTSHITIILSDGVTAVTEEKKGDVLAVGESPATSPSTAAGTREKRTAKTVTTPKTPRKKKTM